jgi:hypothetical protein
LPRAKIFHEGDAGSFMCIIHTGQVAVQKTTGDGQLVTIATLRSGRSFGEMAVLDGERRSASCVAASNCQLLNLGKDSLEKMLNDAPKIAAKIIRPSPFRSPNACAWPTGSCFYSKSNPRATWFSAGLAQSRAPVDPWSAGWASRSVPMADHRCRGRLSAWAPG